MKKIFIALTLLFAFSFTATAQKMNVTNVEKKEKVSAEAAAKQDALQISEFLGLDGAMTENFYRLFEMKYKTLENELSTERKTELSRIMEAKIRASLDAKSMEKLEGNQELFNRLIN
jgi:hypothetical protein